MVDGMVFMMMRLTGIRKMRLSNGKDSDRQLALRGILLGPDEPRLSRFPLKTFNILRLTMLVERTEKLMRADGKYPKRGRSFRREILGGHIFHKLATGTTGKQPQGLALHEVIQFKETLLSSACTTFLVVAREDLIPWRLRA